ncbi:MAG TPA: 7TM diverse intracellular signaling domain-containing protein [Hymenobacter sp.]|jgi:signal transduction histidine kinase|uniref:sensor histidine kinase n=1 Tax=Hymenobacter sp. TaxID=1898978 RepID=UPI002EDAABF3
MQLRYCFLLMLGWWLGSGQVARAAETPQALRDTLLLTNPEGAHVSEAYRYFTEPFEVAPDPEHAEAQWRAGKFRPGPWHKTLNLGLLHERVWIRLPVRNVDTERLRFLWSIFNFTDSAALYCRRLGQATFTRLGAASSWVPAAERAYPARSLSFPFTLDAGAAAVLLLRVDVHSGGIYLPTYIETAEHFLAWEMGFPFERHWVWLLGFYLSSALFNLVLFAFLRDRIHLWYVAYVVGVTVFLMMEDGLDAMLLPAALYRAVWSVGQFNWILLAAAAGIRIMQLFLRLRSGRRRLYQAGTWLAGAAVVFVAAYAGLFPWAVRHNLGVVQALITTRELLLAGVFAYGWVVLLVGLLTRRRRRLAGYYALTYLFFFAGYAVFWLNHLGFSSFNPVYPNTLAWGLFFELLVLSALLTGRFRHTLRQNAQLRIRQLNLRNAQGARLIAAQEEEREQLARELHDALGPNLMALHLAWQGPAVREALTNSPAAAAAGQQAELLLRHLRDDVRAFSHALLPAEPGLGSLAESIKTLSELINSYGSPSVHTYCDEGLDLLPAPLQQAAYRIVAELLNNAVRHAGATEIQVQVLRHPHNLEVLVEDNGRGFAADTPAAGIGLRGVRARVEYLQGRLHIDSSAQGSSLVVQIPVSAVASVSSH